ncbi:baseplate J/gp47 family protein [Roseovarius sp. D22-M7]|uniref:baseplate J/gp47 family protein n=1 Tax=Roseovarius sp. D22-M7 TaxID=3127116 RepID=UPI00301054B3
MILLDTGCPCSGVTHPPRPDIAPGLQALPDRQMLGFRDIRRALLARLNDHAALEGWRVDPAQAVHRDLGVMVLDFAAYVLAVTGFYDARIAERAYLAPAPDAETLAEIVALIGYIPRPAMVASVRLALETSGVDPVTIPALTAFRSEGFDGEKPQVFEALVPSTVWPQRNRWALAPLAETDFNGTLLFGAGTVPHPGAVLVVADTGITLAGAGRVTDIRSEQDANGTRFRRVRLDADGTTALAALAGTARDTLSATLLRLDGGASPYVTTPLSISGTSAEMHLDAVYGQLRAGDPVVLEAGGTLYPGSITLHEVDPVPFTRTIDSTSVTQTVLQSRIEFDLLTSPDDTANPRLHFAPARMGELAARGRETVVLDDMLAGVDLVGPVVPLGEAPALAPVMLQGAAKAGAEISATVVQTADSTGTLTPADTAKAFATALKQPIRAYGNLIHAVRGETVLNEVLGSSDGRTSFQRFALKKKPLSWVENAALPLGRSPYFDLAVDGIRWTHTRHLTLNGPEDQVFALETLPDGSTEVCFGDGVNGAIPPSGTGNVVALSYRYGGGATKPPAGAITQFKRPVKDIALIHSPLPATGGADAETPDELKRTAPDFALTLDRAVSVADFEAMARSYTGVLNARAAWGWQSGRQRALVKIVMIPDQGDPSADLDSYLEDRAAPGVLVEVRTAAGDTRTLSVDVLKQEEYLSDDVKAAIKLALFDDLTGLLSPRNVEIGAPLMRSRLTERLHAVAGVAAVLSLRLSGSDMGSATAPAEGTDWFDVEATTSIGVT